MGPSAATLSSRYLSSDFSIPLQLPSIINHYSQCFPAIPGLPLPDLVAGLAVAGLALVNVLIVYYVYIFILMCALSHIHQYVKRMFR